MVPPLLRDPAFWESDENWGTESFPQIPQLQGHVFFRTSGSTGQPKWIALSKQALLLSAATVNRYLRVTENSTWGLALPLHHVGGFGVIARACEAGCKLSQFNQSWDPVAYRVHAHEQRITHSSLVPTQVHDLISAGLAAPRCLQAIVVGGGRLETAAGQAARNLGWPVLASYGMTEACSQIATQSLEALHSPYQKCPLPILPIWQTRLAENGNLQISGPALFSGIVQDGIYQPRRGDWHETSDRVLLENHNLSPLGRADFMVKILGELVDPEEVTSELIDLSKGILHSANFTVIAVPDARSENALVPVLEMPLTAGDIEIFLSQYNSRAAGFRRVGKPVSISEFPRTDLGKLRRKELTEQVLKEFLY